MKIITIVNQKGGVGKTTTAAEVASGLVIQNKKVLLIDGDPQGNLTYQVGINSEDIYTLKDIFDKTISIKQAIYPSDSFGEIIANNILMASADRTYVGIGCLKILTNALKEVSSCYDYCIIDAPPTLGILSWNCIIAANYLIIPVNAAAFSIQGLKALTDTIEEVKESENPNLKILGLLLTRFNPRTNLGKDARETLQALCESNLNTSLFDTTIRQSVSVEDAQARRSSVLLTAPKSKVAADYKNFINELLEKLN